MKNVDQTIAETTELKPIQEILQDTVGLSTENFTTYGNFKAKVLSRRNVHSDSNIGPSGKVVLVTGVSPTAAGEGKTTTTIGLTDALNHLGVRATAAVREPSLGPCFGVKGGAHGGGYSQVAPAQEINLHFNGDLHAITTANNLLASIVDNHIYWGNDLDIDLEQLMFLRAIDINDRSLRRFSVKSRRQTQLSTGFNITAASEVMVVFCLARDRTDLERRLGNIVVARDRNGEYVRAKDLDIQGALTVLLVDALDPNVVQTLEHNPVFIHGGPFANIAHGCNSVIASQTAREHFDVVVTEAGFGADLGAEKFINIKCRQAEMMPDAVVIVATVRSIKMNGGVNVENLQHPNFEAVKGCLVNLQAHVENLLKMNCVPIVAINQFDSDVQEELDHVVSYMKTNVGVECIPCTHWQHGGKGAMNLADSVMACIAKGDCQDARLLYPDEMSLMDKVRTVATEIYRAGEVTYTDNAFGVLKELQQKGFGHLPVCIAKTQYSFSSNPELLGCPTGHTLPIREVRLSAGAEFVVVICGSIMTLPGLPKVPAANQVRINSNGDIEGIC